MLTGREYRVPRAVAIVIALISAVMLPLAAAGTASADQVRAAQQWVLDALNVPTAWQISQGRGVLVGVIDSGVNPAVSDLVGSVTSGPDLTAVGTPVTSSGWGLHGTWMASLIAGHGHGQHGLAGIRGVAPEARILSIRVITDRSDPGYAKYRAEPPSRGQHELARAIRYAVSRGVGVISMSLGYDVPSLVVRSALQYALNHNVVVIASSGNSGTAQTAQGQGQAPYSFPADYPGVLGVAAINRSGLPAYFSSENLSVEVAAPGVNVPAQGRDGRYWLVSGTSPACALIAGVAALIRSSDPRLTAAQIRRAITTSTTHRPAGGYDDTVGFGTVDATAALLAARRLAKQAPGGNSAAARANAAGYFGNGPAAVPRVPVPPRGRGVLLAWCALAAVCLLVVAGSVRRLSARPGGRVSGAAATTGEGTAGSAAWTPPPSGFQGTAVDLRYPPTAFPGQPYPGQSQSGQPFPPQGFPPQGFPPQGFPPQGFPSQGFPGQPYQGRGNLGQSYPGQPLPGQPLPGQPLPGQPFPPPGYQGQGYPEQLQPLQPRPGQPQPLPGQPVPGQPVPGQPVPLQPRPGQTQPGHQIQPQGYPGQLYPGQPQSLQPRPSPPPGQPFPPQSYPGQPPPQPQPQRQPGQTLPGTSQPGQPFTAQGHPGPVQPLQAGPTQPPPGQPYPAAGYPGQSEPVRGLPRQPAQQPAQAQTASEGFRPAVGRGPGDVGEDPEPAEPPTQPQPRWDAWRPPGQPVPPRRRDPEDKAT